MKTRRMFLVALCGVAMLIGASSCKKEKQENENGETMTIKASLSSVDNNSKTHLEGKKVMWDMGDAFKLFRTVSTESTKFSLTRIDETDGKVAYFEGKHPGDAPYYACYPFNNVSCTTAGTFTFSIPQVQNDSPETVSDNSNAGPMVGFMEKSSGSLVFQNAMSWLKVGLIGDVTIKRVTLTDNDGKHLNGTLTVSDITVGDDGTITGFKTAMTGGSNQLEIVSNEGFPLDASRYTYFWFQVPAGSLERLKLAAYTSTANDASDVLNLEEKQISGGMQENTILSANVTSTPVNYTSPTLTLKICKNCKETILGRYTAGVPTTAKFGVCYVETTSGTEIPTIEDTKVEIGTLTATGDYQADLDTDLGLDHSKMYRVRTYVDNGVVTYSDKVYTVDWPKPLPSNWTNNGGKNPHPFTVASGKVVYFSQGNLQYTTTGSHSVAGGGTATGTWRFAEHQFDVIGADNKNAAQTYTGWIDLFGWGTSGYHQSTDSYNVNYQPWATSSSEVNESYNRYGYGPSTNKTPGGPSGMTQSQGNISGSYYDWGVNCAISNGGNQAGKWRTLTGGSNGELSYLINSRPNAASLYGMGKVGNCTPGVIILPDDWSWTGDVAEFGPSVTEESRRWKPGKSSWSNVYSYSEWAKMEAAGAVFLPAAGIRFGSTSVNSVGANACYWCSSYLKSSHAHCLFSYSDYFSISNATRYHGFSVRLVSDKK